MDLLDLDAIEARANAATPGPWASDFAKNTAGFVGAYDVAEGSFIISVVPNGLTQENAAFIGHSRTDVPALIAEIRRLREELVSKDEARERGAVFPEDLK